MNDFDELELVEEPALELLADLGWEVRSGLAEVLGKGGTFGRETHGEVVLRDRLLPKLEELNPDLPASALEAAYDELTTERSALDPTRANRAVWELLRDGAKVVYSDVDGTPTTESVRIIDWTEAGRNDFLAVSQLWITGPLHKRRADIVCFVNGVPLVFVELKASHRKLLHAYQDNLRDYRDTIPQLFWFNAFVVLSNGSDTRVGATYAPWEFFGEWKRINSEGEQGIVSLETALRGTCDPPRLIDITENFVAYSERPGGLAKALARNHQFLGVNQALAAMGDLAERDRRLGVFWHTQGSGKSLSMFWFTQKVLRKLAGNWTFVVVTDRRELDDQLYREFEEAGAIRAGHVQADSARHLRELLGEDHRYVFTLIHKFRPDVAEEDMPVLSDRRDIIVISDEAHRTQYAALALNMRTAMPEASFLGFTGTPLIQGEDERTREVFGDYVSVYDFRDSIRDGATVPLFYENRIPELQIINERFDEEMEDLLNAADLDEAQERAVARRFGREYELITRPDRLEKVAADLVAHFVGRGFPGKAMYVGVDKAATVRMYDLVVAAWASHLEALRDELDRVPELERPWLQSRIDFMEETDMAVVVSQSQNEVADLAELGLDIRPHRERMLREDLDDRFKDSADPFRLVFVCGMWMTGFDVPSCSTIYLDRPMRNHNLMQTIARANRVFPEKENGLIVDYIGVFRDLEKALAIYATGRGDPDGETPIKDKGELVAALRTALDETTDFCDRYDVPLGELALARGFEFIALRDHAIEALLVDDETKQEFLSRARLTRRLFKAVLPDPAANEVSAVVAVIRNLAEKIGSLSGAPDISEIRDDVQALLDRSVGAEEYVIRAAADHLGDEELIDLNEIDFETLAARLAGRKRTVAEELKTTLQRRISRSAEKNPTRRNLAERLRELIDDYNAASLNVDEFLRRLQRLSQDLSDDEARTVREGLTESELAIFDLLTRPGPELSEDEREQVKGIARHLLARIEDRLVLDWRKRAQTRAAIQVEVNTVLDELPETYDSATYDAKCQSVFEHVFDAYFGEGRSVYTEGEPEPEVLPVGAAATAAADLDGGQLTEEVVRRIETDEAFAAIVALQLRGISATFALSLEELLARDESTQVEFKSTARWNLREGERDPRMEDAVVKTVAGFLNADGGTLLIGVSNDGEVLGLDHDYQHVKPKDADGFVNWLTTHLINALGHTAALRTKIRVQPVDEHEVCRLDASASSEPVFAKTSKDRDVFFVRANNSTRAIPAAELDAYVKSRWGRPLT